MDDNYHGLTAILSQLFTSTTFRLAVNAVVVTTVLTALGTLLAILRFSIRRRETLGTDDYILMVS